jgi:hypothetical protein
VYASPSKEAAEEGRENGDPDGSPAAALPQPLAPAAGRPTLEAPKHGSSGSSGGGAAAAGCAGGGEAIQGPANGTHDPGHAPAINGAAGLPSGVVTTPLLSRQASDAASAASLASSAAPGGGGRPRALTSQARALEFKALQQHIDELTDEKFVLQRTLDQQAKLADSLAQENEAITRRYNEQVHARAWPHRPLG